MKSTGEARERSTMEGRLKLAAGVMASTWASLAISSLLQEPGTCKRGRHAFAGLSIAMAKLQSRASHSPGGRAGPPSAI
jgi:hypothetical protein